MLEYKNGRTSEIITYLVIEYCIWIFVIKGLAFTIYEI